MGGAGLLARVVAIGLLLGAIGAIGTVRALRSLLYGVQPADPATFGMVAALLGAIGVIACAGLSQTTLAEQLGATQKAISGDRVVAVRNAIITELAQNGGVAA